MIVCLSVTYGIYQDLPEDYKFSSVNDVYSSEQIFK